MEKEKKCIECREVFNNTDTIQVHGELICQACVCPDDDSYECYSCGEETGHGMDSGQCFSCTQLENPEMY